MKNLPTLSRGQRVRGTHIFGNKYEGVISSVRCHTMDADRMVVFIDFDRPTELGVSPSVKTGDVRSSICTEVYPPQFAGDKLWQDGAGGSFEVVSAWDSWSALELKREIQARMTHLYAQTDGSKRFPNSAEGDLLKMVDNLLNR